MQIRLHLKTKPNDHMIIKNLPWTSPMSESRCGSDSSSSVATSRATDTDDDSSQFQIFNLVCKPRPIAHARTFKGLDDEPAHMTYRMCRRRNGCSMAGSMVWLSSEVNWKHRTCHCRALPARPLNPSAPSAVHKKSTSCYYVEFDWACVCEIVCRSKIVQVWHSQLQNCSSSRCLNFVRNKPRLLEYSSVKDSSSSTSNQGLMLNAKWLAARVVWSRDMSSDPIEELPSDWANKSSSDPDRAMEWCAFL